MVTVVVWGAEIPDPPVTGEVTVSVVVETGVVLV